MDQAAIGTHRVAVAEVVALLAAAGAPCLLQCVRDLRLLPALLALSFAAPHCNALHAPTAQCLGCAARTAVLLTCWILPGIEAALQAQWSQCPV